jgi:hypothetical protein
MESAKVSVLKTADYQVLINFGKSKDANGSAQRPGS